MFAQESVMEIQKEKIKQEFWNWAKVENPRVVENAELGDVYAIQILDHMFMGFAAAKAQAVPEGFVLVEKTKLMQIVGSAAIIEPITRGNPLMSKYKTELDFILSTVRAMIEAQEPAND